MNIKIKKSCPCPSHRSANHFLVGLAASLSIETTAERKEEKGIMARLLSNTIFKAIARASPTPIIVPASFKHNGMRFSTSVPNDPDSHEDFQPNNNGGSGFFAGVNFKEVVEKDVNNHPVVIYMKGYPDRPQCGFSAQAVRVLKQYNVPLSARNILEFPDLKLGVKEYRSRAQGPAAAHT